VLSCGVVCVILRLAVLVEHGLVTDRRTDTGLWLVPRYHRAVITVKDTHIVSIKVE